MRASSHAPTKPRNQAGDRIVVVPDRADAVSDSYDGYQETLRNIIKTIWKYPLTTQGLVAAAHIQERDAQRFMARQKCLQGAAIWRLENHPELASKFLAARLACNITNAAKDARRAQERAAIEREKAALAEREKRLEEDQ